MAEVFLTKVWGRSIVTCWLTTTKRKQGGSESSGTGWKLTLLCSCTHGQGLIVLFNSSEKQSSAEFSFKTLKSSNQETVL